MDIEEDIAGALLLVFIGLLGLTSLLAILSQVPLLIMSATTYWSIIIIGLVVMALFASLPLIILGWLSLRWLLNLMSDQEARVQRTLLIEIERLEGWGRIS